jgi:hypothetical protein
VLCGCNPFFGIQSTELVDAPPEIDAAPPPACPAAGTAPTFGPDLTMVPAKNLSWFTPDAAQVNALALGYDQTTGNAQFIMGPIGEPMAAMTMLPEPTGYIANVRLAPEGDALFVTAQAMIDPYVSSTSEYRLVDGRWIVGNAFTPPRNDNSFYELSTPTRGPLRRFVMVAYDGTTYTNQLAELTWDGTNVTEVSRTPLTSFELYNIMDPSLTADGLRLVFSASSGYQPGSGSGGSGGSGTGTGCLGCEMGGWEPGTIQPVLYLERPSIDVPFEGMPKILEAVPDYVRWPHLSEDCGRIYFYALNTTWYLKQ